MPNQHSSSDNFSANFLKAALVLLLCTDPSALKTSHITRISFFPLIGSEKKETGRNKQSLSEPSACCVLEPSKPHSGNSAISSIGPSTILVLLLNLAVGVCPSIHIYSAFTFFIYSSFTFNLYKMIKLFVFLFYLHLAIVEYFVIIFLKTLYF